MSATPYDLTFGPKGHVTKSRWACPWCGRVLEDVTATTKVGFHRLRCPERRHPEQSGLSAYTDGGDAA